MPDGSIGIDGGAVLLSAEDDLAATIRPRLLAADADLARILAVQTVRVARRDEKQPEMLRVYERGICLPRDIEMLERAITQVDARLVVIDPLMAYLDCRVNSWRDQDLRAMLAPLARLAERTGVAVLILRHLNKASGGNAGYRGGGSIGIIGPARSGFVIAKDPDDSEHQRVLASSKSTLGPPMPALRYRLSVCREANTETAEAPNGAGTPYVEWLGACDYTATALLNATIQETADTRTALEEAIRVLREMLREGLRASQDVLREGANLGISAATLKRARGVLGVRSIPGSYQGQWLLSLPEDDAQTEK